ncbi:mRNA capping enzyme-domain-containing protein [Rhodotorula diobovata]|uniref:mRNA cap guanine-N(7) methyltransferase n=1 Tax=Rhodotorula diobovata TaxID=5288 RepID=A0A5C5G3C6_9BASI|nr:mRNA capping enzyme-domain-containing protein [Rhodotorula diobovata]
MRGSRPPLPVPLHHTLRAAMSGSLQNLLGSNETLQPAARPYAPTRRVTPASSVLVPISAVELAQCQTSVNPLRTSTTKPLHLGGSHPSTSAVAASLPPPPASLPARPDLALAAAARHHQQPHKRPSSTLNGHQQDQHDQKRWKGSHDTRTVADHYNARPNTNRLARRDSPIIGLKNFNNWIKSVLIAKYGRREGDQTPKIRVLDLGCGKGGDLHKWTRAGTEEYVGIDIAAVSIAQAQERYDTMRGQRFPARFFTLDCFENSIEDVLPASTVPRPFDIVSMQFCMHYAFETEDKVRTMLANVVRYLKPGGVFVGTIPDAKNLFEHLSDPPDPANPLVFGNAVYSVKFDEREWPSAYGHRYTFFLQDAVEEVPEYVVYWDNFVTIAAEYGLSPVYCADFSSIFADEQEDPHFAQLLRRMKVMDDEGNAEMDEDQLDAAMLYLGFAFVKTDEQAGVQTASVEEVGEP